MDRVSTKSVKDIDRLELVSMTVRLSISAEKNSESTYPPSRGFGG